MKKIVQTAKHNVITQRQRQVRKKSTHRCFVFFEENFRSFNLLFHKSTIILFLIFFLLSRSTCRIGNS